MFNSIANVVSESSWTYVLLIAVVAGDAVFPVLPGETVIIAAAVLAAQGHLNIALVIVAAVLGALVGDNAAYGIGRSGLRRVADRLLRSEKNHQRLEWGRSQLEHHGVWIIVVGRFIPGGRTATTYVAGTVEMPWKRRFLPADVIAAGLWGLYASALGYVGGRSFENNVWLPMLIGERASWWAGSESWCVASCSTEAARRKTADTPLDRRTPLRRRRKRKGARLLLNGRPVPLPRQRLTRPDRPCATPPAEQRPVTTHFRPTSKPKAVSTWPSGAPRARVRQPLSPPWQSFRAALAWAMKPSIRHRRWRRLAV